MADTKTERYVCDTLHGAVYIHDGERTMAFCGHLEFQNIKDGELIVRALNTLADLEQVKSVGTANENARPSAWVSVKDKLPKNAEDCLVSFLNEEGRRLTKMASFYNDKWWDIGGSKLGRGYRITHWMPLPVMSTAVSMEGKG